MTLRWAYIGWDDIIIMLSVFIAVIKGGTGTLCKLKDKRTASVFKTYGVMDFMWQKVSTL